MVTYSNSALLEALEGATIVAGEIIDDEGVTLWLADGRALYFVSSSFGLMLKRLSTENLH